VASDPASGSVQEIAHSISPAAKRGRKARLSASLPQVAMIRGETF